MRLPRRYPRELWMCRILKHRLWFREDGVWCYTEGRKVL